jgi:hypothetical protein
MPITQSSPSLTEDGFLTDPSLAAYFPPTLCDVVLLTGSKRIQKELQDSNSVTNRNQGPVGDTGYYQLVACTPTPILKRLIVVAAVKDVKKVRKEQMDANVDVVLQPAAQEPSATNVANKAQKKQPVAKDVKKVQKKRPTAR